MKRILPVILLTLTIVCAFSLLFIYFQRSVSQVNIYRTPTVAASSSSMAETPEGKVIDINHASKEELIELPGIGEVIAENIIKYRTECQGFDTLEELRDVPGIGEKKYQSILPYIKLE